MKIELSKLEIEELIISLVYTNFIKDQNRQCNNAPHLLKFLLEEAYNAGYVDLVTKRDNQIFMAEEVFEKAVYLFTCNDGESTDDVSQIIKEAGEIYRKQLLN